MSACLERLLSLFLVLAPFNLNADTVVLVRVHDQANIRSRTLLHCLSHLQRILVSAGASVDVAVFDAKVDGGAHTRSGDVSQIHLWIVPVGAREMRNVRREPLGQSVLNRSGDAQSFIFLPTVKDEADASGVSWPAILAFAAAHEVGHALLRTPTHAIHGIMKPFFDREDLTAISQNALKFSHEQQQIIAAYSHVSPGPRLPIGGEPTAGVLPLQTASGIWEIGK